MSFRQLVPATCDATFAWDQKFFVESRRKSKQHQGILETRSKSQSKQTFLHFDQVNFKEQVVSSFLAADIPLHKLNHPFLKSLFARMRKVLPSETAARAVAYAGFFNGGVLETSHHNDVKILHYNYSSFEVLKCIVLQYFRPKLQLTMIKLYNAITKETTKIFHSHFCLMLCVSFKERKGFTGTQAVRPWLKIF